MFLIDRILLETELERQSNYLARLAQRLELGRTDMLVELKVLTMNKIRNLNQQLYAN